MKHTRKLVSLLLVLALALAISPPAFAEGEISASLTNGTLSFSTIKSSIRAQVTGASYVSGLSVAPAQGTLYQGYVSEANPGAGVATSEMYYFNTSGGNSIDSVTFVPNPNYSGDAKISYTVFGTSDDASSSVSGTITVRVNQQEASLSYSSNGEAIRFQSEDFSAWCLSVNGRSIRSVSFTLPSSRYGTLYYNYADKDIYDGLVDSSTQYYRTGLPTIDSITLIPAENYNGTFYIPFAGTDISGTTVRGQVRISVSGGAAASGSDFNYTVAAGQSVAFRTADFTNACYNETGYDLNYVRFTRLPDSGSGTLYYRRTEAISTATSYYSSGSVRLIADVSFAAGSGTDDSVTIPYTGYSTQGTSFAGTITIDITGGSSTGFSYTVKAGQRVYIRASEIAEACSATTGSQLSYVRFPTLPSASRGILYHNATRVTTSTNYYSSGNDYLLENVNFLADDSYEGSFTIPFTAYSSRGTSFQGALRMQVTDAGSSAIIYIVRAGQRIDLRVEDFSGACSRKTGYPLNYVRFTSLPASSCGVFYENDNTAVSTYTNYYRSGNTHLLENISFVANANYSGTFSVPYTCYSSGGSYFSGTFSVTVTSASASQPSLITYYTSGPAAEFDASDFSSAMSSSLSGSLAGVRFTDPDTSAGRLCHTYISPTNYGYFTAAQSYSPAMLSQISFLPRAGYSGTVNISYTATDNSGNTTSGTVQVIVTPPLVSSYFNDMEFSRWAVPAVDFLYNYRIVSGVNAYQYAPTKNMRRGDFILMLNQAYAFPPAGTASFSDVPQNSYYAEAIAAARSAGIAAGDSFGNFLPQSPITRQDAAVLLYRCLTLNGQSLPGTESDLYGFPDRGGIASYAIDAMAALVRLGVLVGDEHGLLKPTDPLTRAEMASILYRVFTY